jgi:predicted ATPase with chaperone activity
VLRVGRTIADLEGEKRTGPAAIAEALGYRDDWSGGATGGR